MNMAIQSNMAERFEELDVDYMRGFIDYYYTQEVGKIKGFILKHELGLWPPIIVGAMSKHIKMGSRIRLSYSIKTWQKNLT
jgi:hypothetical protein